MDSLFLGHRDSAITIALAAL